MDVNRSNPAIDCAYFIAPDRLQPWRARLAGDRVEVSGRVEPHQGDERGCGEARKEGKRVWRNAARAPAFNNCLLLFAAASFPPKEIKTRRRFGERSMTRLSAAQEPPRADTRAASALALLNATQFG